MYEGSRLRGLPLFGIAVAGMVLGHLATYLIAFPEQNQRHLVLQNTGHVYLPAFAHVALLLALAGAITIAARAWTTSERSSMAIFASVVSTLALVQIAAFIGQEVLERVIAGAPLSDLTTGPVLALGVTVQVVTAFVGAAAAMCLARVSDRVGLVGSTERVRFWRPDALESLAATHPAPVNADVPGGPRGRAPPSI